LDILYHNSLEIIDLTTRKNRWDNLMFLCIECHNAIHAELDAMTTPNGLTSGASLLVRPTRGMIFNELGDLVAVNDNEHDNN